MRRTRAFVLLVSALALFVWSRRTPEAQPSSSSSSSVAQARPPEEAPSLDVVAPSVSRDAEVTPALELVERGLLIKIEGAVPGALARGATIAVARQVDGRELLRAVVHGPELVSEELPPARYVARARVHGSAEASTRFEVSSDDALTRVFLEVTPAARIEGIVLAADGAPVEGAEVFASWDAERAFERTTSEREGRFVLERASQETRYLLARHVSHGVATAFVDAAPSTIELRFGAVERFHGTVRAGGAPVEGAQIFERVEPPYGRYLVATTDAAGQYEFTNAGGWLMLVASAPGFAEAEKPALFGGVDFELVPGAALWGTVSAHDGAPVDGVELRARCGGAAEVSGSTDLRGEFRFAALAGPCDLTISHPRHPTMRVVERTSSGERSYRFDPSATLELTVTDQGGAPIAQVSWMTSEGTGGHHARGPLRIGGLRPGPLTVSVAKPGYVTEELELVIPSGGRLAAHIVLETAGRVQGRVHGWHPLQGLHVIAYDDQGRAAASTRIASGGVFEFSSLAPGRYTIRAPRRDAGLDDMVVVVEAGQTRDVALR